MTMVLAIAAAVLLDRVFGEPPARCHPVVAMGRYLGAVGPALCRLRPAAAFGAGLLAWAAGALVMTGLAALLQHALLRLAAQPGPAPWLAAALLGVALKPLFAWRLLFDEVRAVEQALRQGLSPARRRLARLVSRDTTALREHEVREAALESLAENLNDSVVAPLLWFALAGLPGAALYRYANTADAMWGYRGRWEWTGKAAARIDDVLSWLPARLSAAALLGARAALWRRLPAQARLTPSPNGGWPMGALALRLGVRLSKPGVYTLNAGARTARAHDAARALQYAGRAALVAALAAGLLAAARWPW